MLPKERVLTALKLGKPDKIPFLDNIDHEIEEAIIGKKNYDRLEVAKAFGLDGMGYEGFFPPLFAEKRSIGDREYLLEGMIKTRSDLAKVKFPDPDNEAFYDDAKRFIDKYKDTGYALYARTRLGASGVLNSMGLENFSYALIDDIGLIENLLDQYVNWSSRVIEHINKLGFDFIWCFDDIAYNSSLMFAPQVFKEVFLPRLRIPAGAAKIPWIYHSDGNLMQVMEELLSLGMSGLHPLQPDAMDIEAVKKAYGKRVCLLGNIDLHYTLTLGTVQEVEEEVKKRIETIGADGGYIITSSNTITSYCKVENVKSMIESIKKYRDYR
jgi:uroporphyrinogen decarboxylase